MGKLHAHYRLYAVFLFLYNSVKIAFFVVFGTLLTCSLAGYAFAKLRFPGRKPLFLLLLSTMMIPTQVTLIPVFVIMKYLGWINTHYALIVPAFLAAFLARFCCASFFSAFPTNWKTLRALTAARRGVSTGASCCRWLSPRSLRWPSSPFMGTWNDFMRPLIYLSDMTKMTLPVGLALLANHQDIRIPLIMAGALLSLLPILVLYVFGQKYFVRGIALTGMKG